ncbi:unnamed protein product [Gordionus sp. m RMFG-2023]
MKNNKNLDNVNVAENSLLPERLVDLEIKPFEEDIVLLDAKIKSAQLSSSHHTSTISSVDTGKSGKRNKKKRLKGRDGSAPNVEILKAFIMQSDNKISQYEFSFDYSSVGKSSENRAKEFEGDDVDIEKKCGWRLTSLLESQGHSSDVRSLGVSQDQSLILSSSGESVKIWNRLNQRCIRTMPCEYGLCSLFLPGDKFIAVGSKTGRIHLYDCQTGELLENVEAHVGPVWAICLHPNQTSIISGGGDKTVKFWELELVEDLVYSPVLKRLTLINSRSFVLPDDILCLKASPDERFLAVGLLDNTVKIFYLDTLKFYLCLYGHSMPVTCLDISSDSDLLVTGSNDKVIKIWGAKFGDCHKTLFGHSDTITNVLFLPPANVFEMGGQERLERDSHLFFSAGKDGLIIQWDADKFEKIFVLKGHHAEIWSVAVCSTFLISASHDKTLRIWYKSDEIINPKEEAEREMLEASEMDDITNLPTNVPLNLEANGECGLASAKSLETLDSTERLIQALEFYSKQCEMMCEDKTSVKVSTTSQKSLSADAIIDEDEEVERSGDVEMNDVSDDEGFAEAIMYGQSSTIVQLPEDLGENVVNAEVITESEITYSSTTELKTLGQILLERQRGANGNMMGVGRGKQEISPEIWALNTCLKQIKYSELEYSTLLLPRQHVTILLDLLYKYLEPYITTNGNSLNSSTTTLIDGQSLEITVKLLCFLLKTQYMATSFGSSSTSNLSFSVPDSYIPAILALKDKICSLVNGYKNILGFNQTVLRHLNLRINSHKSNDRDKGLTSVNANLKFNNRQHNDQKGGLKRKKKRNKNAPKL